MVKKLLLTVVAALVVAVVAVLTLHQPTAVSSMPSFSHPFPELRPERPASARITTADGKVPAGVTIFDEHYPAVTKLDPALLSAVRRASTAAGIMFVVNSGWRSLAYQQALFDQAVRQHGSASAAARWVARPGTSVHEAGDAVDLGPTAATTWLAEHGAAYGLCQIYANEPWHYELRPDADEHGCPAAYADPTDDPRMQQ